MLAEWTGLEPATPGVTGRYSNQLNYHSAVSIQHNAIFDFTFYKKVKINIITDFMKSSAKSILSSKLLNATSGSIIQNSAK